MYTLLVILYIVVCLFLIMVVLLQQGKGADVAAAFGGGGTQTAFGPRGTATLMHKLTTASFILFVVICLGLSVMTARTGRSVTSGLKAAAPAATPAPATGTEPEQAPPAAAEQQPGSDGAATTQTPVE